MVVDEGETVIVLLPDEIKVPPQDPEYQYIVEPEGTDADKVVEFPWQIEEGEATGEDGLDGGVSCPVSVTTHVVTVPPSQHCHGGQEHSS